MVKLGQCGPFVDGKCKTCSVRKEPDPMAFYLYDLARAARGGLRIAEDTIDFELWPLLAELRDRHEVELAVLTQATRGVRG